MNSVEFLNCLNDKRLTSRSPALVNQPDNRRAAIAIVVFQQNNQDQILFIQRALSEKDPWSGQIACPGGGWEDKDVCLSTTAIRETREEVGLVLSDNEQIGQLDDQVGSSKNQKLPLTISAYVYRITAMQSLSPNYEVGDAFWVPVSALLDEKRQVNYQTPFRSEPYQAIDLGADSSCIPASSATVPYGQSKILWGLTYRFVQQLLEVSVGSG